MTSPNYHINDGVGNGQSSIASIDINGFLVNGSYNSIPGAIWSNNDAYPGVLDNAWTPDGRMIYTDGSRENIWVYDPCKGSVTRAVGGRASGAVSRPSMGLDPAGVGTPYIFWSEGNNIMMCPLPPGGGGTVSVFLYGTNGNPLLHPHISDDAKVVVFSQLDQMARAQIYAVKLDKSVGPVAVTTSGTTLTHSDHPHVAGPNVNGNYVVAHRQYDPTGYVETDPTTYKSSQIGVEWVNPSTLANVGQQSLAYVASGQHKMVTNPSLHPDLSAVLHDVADKGDITGTPFGGAKDVALSNGAISTVATLTTDPTKVTNHLASKGVRRVK